MVTSLPDAASSYNYGLVAKCVKCNHMTMGEGASELQNQVLRTF